MFGRLFLLLLPSVAFCFDAVVWSSGDAIDRASPPELSKLIESATLEKPLVLFVLKNFQLADFSRHANVYGEPSKANKGLKKWIATSKGYAAEWLDEAAQLPVGGFVKYEGELSAITQQPVVVVSVESFAVIDDLADNILQSLDRPYIAVLTGEEAVTTHAIKKRVSTSDSDSPRGRPVRPGARDAANANANFPVVLPPTNVNLPCLLYIGRIGLQVYRANAKDNSLSNVWVTGKYDDSAGNYKCSNTSAYDPNANNTVFTISLAPGDPAKGDDYKVSSLTFTIQITRSVGGYWELNAITINDLKMDAVGAVTPKAIASKPNNSSAQAQRWGVNSVDRYSYACSITEPAWVNGLIVDNVDMTTMKPTDPNKIQVGLVISNFQLQPYWVDVQRKFSRNVDDCVPTFSVGSWMGLTVGLILLFAFLFAMTMLNSVQTMDRFDDPKQKQIIINFKE